jgi:type II secretory pathway pseudopilin PulG
MHIGTMIEILIAIVLIGLTMGVLFASITMSSTGSNNQKNLAIADGLLRNYAEAAKTAVRTSCTVPGTFTVTAPAAPAGFTVTPLSISQGCPSVTTAPGVTVLQLFVKVPNISAQKELDVAVRTP